MLNSCQVHHQWYLYVSSRVRVVCFYLSFKWNERKIHRISLNRYCPTWAGVFLWFHCTDFCFVLFVIVLLFFFCFHLRQSTVKCAAANSFGRNLWLSLSFGVCVCFDLVDVVEHVNMYSNCTLFIDNHYLVFRKCTLHISKL